MTILPFKFINMSGLDITSKCEDDQDDEAGGGECVTVCYSVTVSVLQLLQVTLSRITTRAQ